MKRLASLAAVTLAAALSGCSPAPSARVTGVGTITCAYNSLESGYDCTGSVAFDRRNWNNQLDAVKVGVDGIPDTSSVFPFAAVEDTVAPDAHSVDIYGMLDACAAGDFDVTVSLSFWDDSAFDQLVEHAHGSVDATGAETAHVVCQ